MSENKKQSELFIQIIVAVVIAILVGGSSPWWWKELFPNETQQKSVPVTPVSTKTKNVPPPVLCKNGTFDDGECLPPIGSKGIEPRLMYKLFDRCNANGGKDRYTNNCCDHLSIAMARERGVCGQQ